VGAGRGPGARRGGAGAAREELAGEVAALTGIPHLAAKLRHASEGRNADARPAAEAEAESLAAFLGGALSLRWV
jgi:hypothetical protein